ncbi:hypothetical protein BCR39DRAFT_89832 [Naematelia encephala]|uniref:Centrosomin N-terminal motif 1 domain-containing protein n=1 Tax=Naematelia encephala TaxID=71784 RepID=A0A1Y2BA69_9TREE|nr:hypothetical protein BCR39DRAFT_89832 [Naematelia encephala]
MAASSALTGLMQSPSSNDSTILVNGKTLPDITLGSLGSSFRSEDEELRQQGEQGALGRIGSSRAPNMANLNSPETSNSTTLATPSPPHAPASALLGLSPPTTIRKSSSHSAIPESQAPRRSRIMRKMTSSSVSSSSDVDGALAARYGGGTDDESDGPLSSLSLNVSPGKRPNGLGSSRTSYYAGPSRRAGRHSVAADVSSTGPLTLRDQEQQLNAAKKDIFNLQLENHFLKERLANMAPDHIEAALKENVRLKLEILNLSKEMKRLKKLLLQQDKDLAEAQREREGGRGVKARDGDLKELEQMYKAEKDRRKAVEKDLQRLQEERGDDGAADEDTEKLRAQLEDTEASENVWRQRAEELEEELDNAKAMSDDQKEEIARLQDATDRAEEELERLKTGLGDSVGLGRGREARMIAKLEQEKTLLQEEIDALRQGSLPNATNALEDRINELRDKLAAAQLDVDRRDQEIEQLNEELDIKVRDYDREIQQVEAEWRDEVLEARAQVDELKDALEAKDQEYKELREALLEREEDILIATERVAELEANQNETHDRLEDTLKSIERDNAEKDADLVGANREIETMGQQIYELEEAAEELRVREQQLANELRTADEQFESTKTHYENLVAALKEARAKTQTERDDALADVKALDERRKADKESARKILEDEKERNRRALADKDQVVTRLQTELEAARDRVSMRDRDVASLQNALRNLEADRQKLGDEHTSDRFSLELELERVKRDLAGCEDELAKARDDVEDREEALRKRDLEMSQLLDKQRDLEARLSSERQGRLNMSDKLDIANKHARQYEKDAVSLRERIEELEPLLTETQQERIHLQKQSEQQRQERSELLLRVFKDVNKFLGADDHATPANFAVFRDTLLARLRSINQVRSDFEKRIRETESSVDQRMGALKKQIEQKWRALDNFESSVKKLALTRMQWRSKFALKDGELEAAKSRNAELSQQLSIARAGSTTSDSASLRSLTERAQTAERRAQMARNQLEQLEAKLAELQAKSGQAENKWEARVKEYENRLRIAGEKIKTEKQGGKERARELEAQIRELETQVEQARKRNQRAEGIVATASHLLPTGSQ